MKKIYGGELKNGIRYVVADLPWLHSVSVNVGLEIGSRFEEKNEEGLSHFLEHLAFKGTNKRPSGEIVNRELDEKGAEYNAETSWESTEYYLTTTEENKEWAVEILSDLVGNLKIDKSEVDKERKVIIEEIGMYQDNPIMGVSGDFYKWIYQKNPGCWDVAGSKKQIRGYLRDDLINYRKRTMNNQAIVVTVAGKGVLGMEKVIEKYFGDWNYQGMKAARNNLILNPNSFKKIEKNYGQDHLVWAIPGIGVMDDNYLMYQIGEILLAGNSSSWLFEEIREKRGLAYYVNLIGESFKDTGILAVQSGVKKGKADEVCDLIEKVIADRLLDLKEAEIDKTKAFLIGKIQLQLDKTNYWSSYLADKLLIESKVGDLEEEVEKIKKLDCNSIKECLVGLVEEVKGHRYLIG